MILEKTVKLSMTGRAYKYYKEKGYKFDFKEIIEIPIEDLNPESKKKEKRLCDICGKIYIKGHNGHLETFSRFGKDVCTECFKTNKEIKEIIQKKREDKFLEKYGVLNPMDVPELIEKISKTTEKRYGVKNCSQLKEFREKQENTMLERYGARKALQVKEFQEKFVKTITSNFSTKTSSQQIACYNLLKEHGFDVQLNYPFSNCILDILIKMPNGTKIDFEYDGTHWHNENTKNRDRRRDEFLKRNGFKIIRIESKRSIPSWEQIKEEIDYIMEDETHTYAHLNIDTNKH